MDNYFDKLTRFCLYRERCTSEVIQKMYELEVPPGKQSALLEELKSEKYIDDERYIKAYIHSKIHVKRWGKKKISAELFMKKLDKKKISELLTEVDDDVYIQHLKDLAVKIWDSLSKKAPKEKQESLFRYMLSKGYESELISDWLKSNKINEST